MDEQQYVHYLFIGGGLFCAWVGLFILTWLTQWCWAWVDRSKINKRNWLSQRIMFALGWEDYEERSPYGSCDDVYYRKGKETSDGTVAVLGIACILAIVPAFSLIAISHYPITLFVISSIVIAYLARFARDGKKAFDRHIKDKEAHQ